MWWIAIRRLAILLTLSEALGACVAPQPPQPAVRPEAAQGSVTLVTHGWHTDIALPAEEAAGPLARFRHTFPGARMLVFGYGKRTFMIAPAHTLAEWMIGPFPGPAAIEVSAISADAGTAYGVSHVMTLPLPARGADQLSAFLWLAFAKDHTGNPLLIAQGNWPGSVFYDAASRYSLGHTCNAWSAEALQAAGLPINPRSVIFAGQIDDQARHILTARGS